MSFFLKPKFLLWVIALLLIANVATFIGVMLAHTEREPSMEKQRNHFFKKLGLSENQKKSFIARRVHFKKLNDPLYDNYDSIMIRLQRQVSLTPPDTAAIRIYTDSLGMLTTKIRHNWIQYSIAVRKYLNSEQQKKYDILTMEHVKSRIGK